MVTAKGRTQLCGHSHLHLHLPPLHELASGDDSIGSRLLGSLAPITGFGLLPKRVRVLTRQLYTPKRIGMYCHLTFSLVLGGPLARVVSVAYVRKRVNATLRCAIIFPYSGELGRFETQSNDNVIKWALPASEADRCIKFAGRLVSGFGAA